MIRPTVHFIWLNPPCPYLTNIKSYAQRGYKTKLWTTMPNMINQDIFDAMNTYAGKSDVMRLEILYRYGGLYTDTDSRMIRPLPITKDLVCMTSASGYIANETIYATKEHPALREAVYGLRANILKHMDKGECNIWELAGATYLTPIFQKYDHIQLPKTIVSRQRSVTRRTSIYHQYHGSWSKGIRKGEKQLIDFWLDASKIKL